MKNILIIGVLLLTCITVIFGFKRSESTVRTVSIGVVVTDLEKSYDFYTNILGMEQIGTWHSFKELSSKLGINSGRAFDIIDLKLDCEGYVLKYKLNKTKGNKQKDEIHSEEEYYGFEKIGARYLTIHVENIDPYVEKLKEHKIKYKRVTLPSGYRVVLFHDPDGALMEIASI